MGSEESRQLLDDARARASALVVLIDALCLAISHEGIHAILYAATSGQSVALMT